MRLLLFGCSGFIGKELVPLLLKGGHKITVVTRKRNAKNALMKNKPIDIIELDPSDPDNWNNKQLIKALSNADGVINLAGEAIADKKWSKSQCKKIEESRTTTTQALIDAMKALKKPPKVLINASAIGVYGTSNTELFNEKSSLGKDFLSNVCKAWENTASNKPNSTRLVIIRIGLVIGKDGGALGKMLPIFRAGLGGPIGSGDQWMSWISRSDLCELISQAIEKRSWQGIINGVSPYPIRMKEFAKTLGQVLHRPSLLPVPGAILKFILGDGAKVVLEGQRVESIILSKLNFQFKYPKLKQALTISTNLKGNI